MKQDVTAELSTKPRRALPVTPNRSPGWRIAGYVCTLFGVVCLMASATVLADPNPAHQAHQAGGWVALGGSAFFFTTGFRLLRERSDEIS